jgi:hypothetical protein
MFVVSEGGDATFTAVREWLKTRMRSAPRVATERWQGVDVKGNPAAVSYEIMNARFDIDLRGCEDLGYWRADIAPNLPWADDHFLERVGGEPLNPGVQWANWPWAGSAGRFRDKVEQFNHTYMERLWPKYARRSPGGKLEVRVGVRDDADRHIRLYLGQDRRPKFGIAWQYGDLEDLIDMLAREPHTRQAWIPLFFPEDTGVGDGGRKPCTLGYQFLVRDNRLHIWYPLRSCDLVRHWADDCYLAVRLLLWVLDRCRERAPDFWGSVTPGTYAMHMTSLHVFENDRRTI